MVLIRLVRLDSLKPIFGQPEAAALSKDKLNSNILQRVLICCKFVIYLIKLYQNEIKHYKNIRSYVNKTFSFNSIKRKAFINVRVKYCVSQRQIYP